MKTLKESILNKRELLDNSKLAVQIPVVLEEIIDNFLKENTRYLDFDNHEIRKVGHGLKRFEIHFTDEMKDLDLYHTFAQRIIGDINKKLPGLRVEDEYKSGIHAYDSLYLISSAMKSIHEELSEYGEFMVIEISKVANDISIYVNVDTELSSRMSEVFRKYTK